MDLEDIKRLVGKTIDHIEPYEMGDRSVWIETTDGFGFEVTLND